MHTSLFRHYKCLEYWQVDAHISTVFLAPLNSAFEHTKKQGNVMVSAQ